MDGSWVLKSPEYIGHKLLIYTAIFVPAQVICVSLRYVCRYLVKASWGLDDLIVLASLVLQICMGGICVGQDQCQSRGISKGSQADQVTYRCGQASSSWASHPIPGGNIAREGLPLGKVPRRNRRAVFLQREHPQIGNPGAVRSHLPTALRSTGDTLSSRRPHLALDLNLHSRPRRLPTVRSKLECGVARSSLHRQGGFLPVRQSTQHHNGHHHARATHPSRLQPSNQQAPQNRPVHHLRGGERVSRLSCRSFFFPLCGNTS